MEDRHGIRVLTLNRPEVRNALSPELREALMQALERAEADPQVRALVLTGKGKAFCSGLDLDDLKAIATRSSEENRQDSASLARLFERLYTFPKPAVAALNGTAVAGGAGLATACDLIVMSEQAKFGYSEVKIGFVPALVGVMLVRQIGERRARELLLSARMISAREAKEMGLVNEVCAPEEVLARAQARAAEMAANAPSSLAMTKALLASVAAMGFGDALRYAIEVNTLARTTDDLKEGVAAFLEKREPTWQR